MTQNNVIINLTIKSPSQDAEEGRASGGPSYTGCEPYRGTSLIRNTHPPNTALGIGLLKGPTWELFLMSEVPLYLSSSSSLDSQPVRDAPLDQLQNTNNSHAEEEGRTAGGPSHTGSDPIRMVKQCHMLS